MRAARTCGFGVWRVGAGAGLRGLLVLVAMVMIVLVCLVGVAVAAPEVPVTEAPSLLGGTSATFNGELNPGVGTEKLSYHFAYSPGAGVCTESGRTAPVEAFPQGEGNHEKVSVPVTGLEGSSEYTVCLVVENAGEEVVEGNTVSFTTMAASPVVEEQLTTSVGQETASLQALVNQELQETTCKDFQYGTTTGYGLLAGCEPEALGAGAGERTNANLTGLSANTEYHYRVLAENASGETQGADETFLTLPADPVVATAPATGVSPHGATLTGSVDPENTGHPEQDATSYFFQWGPTNAYGLQTPVPGGSLGEGNTAKPATAILGGLESGTSYHYRLVAVNDTNRTPQVVYGEDETFTTTATPPSLSPAAVSTTQTTATLTATLETQGLPTRYQLQAAVTGAAQQPLASGNTSTAGPLTISLANLSPGTTYQYTLTAENPNGPSNPATGTFTTTPATPPPAQLTLPPLIPYTPITQLTSREEQEDHHIKNIAPPPTQTQQLAKALKHCHTIKNPHTRHTCEKTAHKHHPTKTKHK